MTKARSSGPAAAFALSLLAVLPAAAVLLHAGSAHAEASVPERELDPDLEGPKRAPASDLLKGQFLLSGSVGFAAPAGTLAVGKAFRSFATEGPSFSLADDYGLSRSFAISAYGSYSLFGAPTACAECKTTSYAVGLGLVYHLTQGLAVDPWVRYGLAYRNISVEVPEAESARLLGGPTSGTFQSLDFVSVALGADYFPWPTLGAGIFASLDVGRSISRPLPDEGAANQTVFALGMRLTFAPARKPLAGTVSSARATPSYGTSQ